jgi:hypothetical protein
MNSPKDSNKQMVELVGAVFFKITGFCYFLSAFSNIWHLQSDIAYVGQSHGTPTRYDLHLHQLLVMDFIYNVALGAAMIWGALPLTRLVCRGLERALDLQKAQETSSL